MFMALPPVTPPFFDRPSRLRHAPPRILCPAGFHSPAQEAFSCLGGGRAVLRRGRSARCIATERNTRSISAESCGDARLMGRPPRAAADCQKKRLAGTAQCLWRCLKPSVRKRCLLSRHLFLKAVTASPRAASHSPPGRFPFARAGGVLALGRRARGQGSGLFEEIVRDVVLQFFFAKSRYF